MTLTEAQSKIIQQFPLGSALDELRHNILASADAISVHMVKQILGVLANSSAALELRTLAEGTAVSVSLMNLQWQVHSDAIPPARFSSLVDSISATDTEFEVWSIALGIIDDADPVTPPRLSARQPSTNVTPLKSSSSHLMDTEGRTFVQDEVLNEIRHCTYLDVGGFFEKFFDDKDWSKEQKQMRENILTQHNGQRWTLFPSIPTEEGVKDWIFGLERKFLVKAPNKAATTSKPSQLDGAKSQLDLFFLVPLARTQAPFSYEDIYVVGELKQSFSNDNFKYEFLQLSRYVRNLLAAQSLRRFAHAFLLCGSELRLCAYDRAGAYCCAVFNIHENPAMFAQVLVAYATMDSKRMGTDSFFNPERLTRQGNQSGSKLPRRITLQVTGHLVKKRTFMLTEELFRSKAIVGRATTCFKTADGHIAKFAWVSEKRTSEVELLQLARSRGVKGVATILAHSCLTSTSEIREGLVFPEAHVFRGSDESGASELPQAATRVSSSKRKATSDSLDVSAAKASRSSGQPSRLNTSSISDLRTEGKEADAEEPQPWENRLLMCHVITPAGRILAEFRTVRELLEALLDAVIAHKSLFQQGGLLHRDITPTNIIITSPRTSGGHRGMLIDLDVAKKVGEGRSWAQQVTGTLPYIAIAVLTGSIHSYRHDLESFLYVLIWMCARQAWANGFAGDRKEPAKSRLRSWEIGSLTSVADAKLGHMGVSIMFEKILDEFPPAFDKVKPLCRRFRTLLFGSHSSTLLEAPKGEPESLYTLIEESFKATLESLE